MKARTTLAFVVALALPGCCGLVDRAEGARSRAFLADHFTQHVAEESRATARTFGTLNCAIAAEVDRCAESLDATCRLYGGH